MNTRPVILCSLFMLTMHFLQAQPVNEAIRQILTNEKELTRLELKKPALVKRYYLANNYSTSFFAPNGDSIRQKFFRQLADVGDLGLKREDYQHHFVNALQRGDVLLTTSTDSASADIRLADAALHLLTEVHGGNKTVSVRYHGLSYQPIEDGIVGHLQKAIAHGDFSKAIVDAGPQLSAYRTALQLLVQLKRSINHQNEDQPVVSTNKLASNKPLLARLKAYGFLNQYGKHTEAAVQAALQSAQRILGQNADGKLNKATLQALNTAIHIRVDEIKELINSLRWLNDLQQGRSVAIVNLPSATMMVYQQGKLVLHSKLIVGKASTPTPTLTSSINEVILYPYWNVPHSIAVKELLPVIKRNRGFIEQNNFQILNRSGTVINPAQIDWASLKASNFPFKIRQSTGCDNSLGIIKFNFYNPFTVYLHDTPTKGLFYLSKRFFSHGCMRVEKPVEFARILLQKDSATVDAMTKQCLRDQKPVTFRLPQTVPVVVLYNTAWFGEKGSIGFFPDAYLKRTTLE